MGAVFVYPAKHLNSNEQRRKNRKGKNKPIRKLTVMPRCVPEKVKGTETRPGQRFRSLWSGLPVGTTFFQHRDALTGPSTRTLPHEVRVVIPILALRVEMTRPESLS